VAAVVALDAGDRVEAAVTADERGHRLLPGAQARAAHRVQGDADGRRAAAFAATAGAPDEERTIDMSLLDRVPGEVQLVPGEQGVGRLPGRVAGRLGAGLAGALHDDREIREQ
jgi:hypothetical protein